MRLRHLNLCSLLRLFHLGPLDHVLDRAGGDCPRARTVRHITHLVHVGSFSKVHDWQVIKFVVIIPPVELIVVILILIVADRVFSCGSFGVR